MEYRDKTSTLGSYSTSVPQNAGDTWANKQVGNLDELKAEAFRLVDRLERFLTRANGSPPTEGSSPLTEGTGSGAKTALSPVYAPFVKIPMEIEEIRGILNHADKLIFDLDKIV